MEIWHKRIKELRENTDVTLKDMAKIIGVSEATVQRYESGKIKELPYEAVLAYAKKFNVNPAFIMGWSDTPVTKKLNIFDLDDPKKGDEFREEQFQKKYDVEYALFPNDITKEEYTIIQAYHDLDDAEKQMVKRMISYSEKFKELFGDKGKG